jgi:hypothetical protein
MVLFGTYFIEQRVHLEVLPGFVAPRHPVPHVSEGSIQKNWLQINCDLGAIFLQN